MRVPSGFVGTRYLVGLGLVAMLVWIVPIMFLSHKQAEFVASAAPAGVTAPAAAGVTAPAPAGATAPAPAGATAPATAGATAPAGVTAPAGATSASGTAPTDPIGKAKDVQAQSLVNSAVQVAQVWYASNGSYEGFDTQQAAADEPGITFTTAAPAEGVVTMRVGPDSVVMVTLSGAGGTLCAATTAGTVSYGRVDAATAAQCTGGW